MALINKFTTLLLLAGLLYCHAQNDTTAEDDTTVDDVTTTTTPTTTTTVTPTPSAGPPDTPAVGSWNYTDSQNRTCILTSMGVRLGFTYTVDNVSRDITYDIPSEPSNSTVSGSCGTHPTDLENINIAFFENDGWQFALVFTYDNSSKVWSVTEIRVQFVYGSTRFPGVTGQDQTFTASLTGQEEFKTSNGSSYQCVSMQPFNNLSGANITAVNVTTYNLQVEAFRLMLEGDFSTSIPCPADTEVSNVVPIAVGAALAALVVIVLVAYLIGRKKSKRGYESV